jgi:integrase
LSRVERASLASGFVRRHAPEEEYAEFRRSQPAIRAATPGFLYDRRKFVRRYPDLEDWFAAPLSERVGRLHGEPWGKPSFPASYFARSYLFYLAMRGHAWFDWEWLLAVRHLGIFRFLENAPQEEVAFDGLEEEAVGLGYDRATARGALRWTLGRIFMHTLRFDARAVGEVELEGLERGMDRLAEHPDVGSLFGSGERCLDRLRGAYRSRAHLVRVVLYHRGQLDAVPRKSHPGWADRTSTKPRMEAVAKRYLAAKGASCRPSTVSHYERVLRHFVHWLCRTHPEVESFAGVTREHLLGLGATPVEEVAPPSRFPRTEHYRLQLLTCLSVFFRETADWGWDEVPGRPLLLRGDLPKRPRRIPRYLPEAELSRLMGAVRDLACPFQRTALLVARWSGARRDEIRRLEMDCVDSYPDGTPRLRIPAGKTYEERLVPLNEEAADALEGLRELRRSEPARGFPDDLSGTTSRRLFVRYGKTLSSKYLFETSLQEACRRTGLVDERGKPTVTGCKALTVDPERGEIEVAGRRLGAGDVITIDGSSGDVVLGEAPPSSSRNQTKP